MFIFQAVQESVSEDRKKIGQENQDLISSQLSENDELVHTCLLYVYVKQSTIWDTIYALLLSISGWLGV